ncbi:hypothetical protein [Blastococcus montanus]|uniref:hypothetical protein n=1 Tax=Blastococcus montanus TaxID=3144973 RepID=UPI003209D802
MTGRAELLDALTELERAGAAVLPRGGALYDRRSAPPLPRWVRRTPAAPPGPRPDTGRVWPSALPAAARIARRPEEFEVLEAAAGFLRGAARNGSTCRSASAAWSSSATRSGWTR